MLSVVGGFILGLILGSFAQAAACRIILGKSLRGRSYCSKCKHQLSWYDLFPVLSFLQLRGHCRYCHKKIPSADFWTEAFTGLLFAFLFGTIFSAAPVFLTDLDSGSLFWAADLIFKSLVVVVLVIIFLVDLKTGLIPDRVTYPAIIGSTLYLLATAGLTQSLLPAIWTFLSAIAATLFFVLLIVGTKGKGMGWGDVKYVLFLGLAVGFPGNLVALFLAFLTGAVVSLVLIALRRKSFGQTVPFGPFLSLGAYIALVWGNQLLDLYLHLN